MLDNFLKIFSTKCNLFISHDIAIPTGKYAIIGDNHGFMDVYRETLKEIQSHNVSGIFHVGDICGSGPESLECIKKTIAHNIIAVKGNHDRFFLGTDKINKYKKQYQTTREQHYKKAKKESPHDLDKLSQFPDIIKTNYFDIVHQFYGFPYYARINGKRHEDLLYSGAISKPVFIGGNHRFYILEKIGINVQMRDLPFNEEIILKTPCIVNIPSMTHSRQKDQFFHAYIIIDIIPKSEGGGMILKAHKLKANFIEEAMPLLKDKEMDQVNAKSKRLHLKFPFLTLSLRYGK